jgi:DNA-binding protein H-NS
VPVNQLKKITQMKKLSLFVAIASMGALVACGPSAEEKAAMEKAKQDSIAAVEAAKAAEEAAKAQAIADSTAAYTAAQEAKAKATADSIEAAKTSKSKPAAKPKAEPKKTDVKPGQGRG